MTAPVVHVAKAEFLISATGVHNAPTFDGQPEFVLVGRSNVGKSSFINALLGRKNLARTSNTPGKTRLINFYPVWLDTAKTEEPATLIFIDLPGYGYAKVSKTEQEKWRKNLEKFLKSRDTITRVVQLIDMRHGPQESDLMMYDWLEHHELKPLVVLNKADKLSKNEMAAQLRLSAKELGVPIKQLFTFSAVSGTGVKDVWQALLG